MSRLLLTDEPNTPYCPHCGQPMKLVGISRLLGRSCPTLLELYCASCDHEEIKEDRPTVFAEWRRATAPRAALVHCPIQDACPDSSYRIYRAHTVIAVSAETRIFVTPVP